MLPLSLILNNRANPLWVGMTCFGALLVAVVLQQSLGWQPCPLCIAQRICIAVAGTLALAAWLSHRCGLAERLLRLFASGAALLGIYAAYEQLLLVWGPPQMTCGPGLKVYLAELADRFPSLGWLLEGPADCAEAVNSLLGLPLAAWVALLLSAVVALTSLPLGANLRR